MKFHAVIVFTAALCSCGIKEPTAVTVAAMRFAVTPLGEPLRATRADPQEGERIPHTITSTDFMEVTIAQGSGRDGFDAIRVFGNSSGYIVFSEKRDRNKKIAISLTNEEITGLLHALNRDKVAVIKGRYSAGIHDGAQGFIEVKTSAGRRYCWLNNHFDPVANTFQYCNRVIWPKIEGARIKERGIDRQAEYDRIFHPENQSKTALANPLPPRSRSGRTTSNPKTASKIIEGICWFFCPPPLLESVQIGLL